MESRSRLMRGIKRTPQSTTDYLEEHQMENPRAHRIETVAQLQALMGEPNPMTPKKVLPALDQAAMDFIRRSPFLVLATSAANGNEDASPKGDHQGFVAIEDERT